VATRVQGTQTDEQGYRLLPGRARWGVKPLECRRIAHAPEGQFQGQGRQIGLQDLGRAVFWTARLLGPGPEPETDAGAEPPGAPGALIRRGQGNGLRHQPGQTRSWLKTWFPGQARIHHHANAGDGEAGLGQVRGQHQASSAVTGPAQDPVLLRHGQGAMQGQDLDALVAQAREPFPDAFDLRGAGQEDEQVALMAGQGLADGGDEGR